MGVLLACKNEEDPIKNEGARAVTTLFIDFSHEPIQAFMVDLVTCKMKKIHRKMKALEWSQLFYLANFSGGRIHFSILSGPSLNPAALA